MNGTFPVFAALPALGFVDRGDDGLKFVHPQCELRVGEGWVPFHPAVWFVGHFNHAAREMGFLEFNLPVAIESLDQLKAFLAYYLSDAMTANVPEWIAEGRALSHLLPWERDMAAYNARDRCAVRREWLRLTLKDLTDALKNLGPAEVVTFTFDGTLLSIDCGRRIMVQAEGSAWGDTHSIRASDLATLPKRLMRDPIEVAAYGGHLIIGNHRYELAKGQSEGDSVVVSAENG
jgi:hypothetical protein